MRFTHTLSAMALGAAVVAVPAAAQTAAPAPPAPAAAAPLCQANISKEARKALVALQTAVLAKSAATIPPLSAAAQAVVKTNDDKCFLAQLQTVAAIDSNNLPGVAAALEAQLASGSIPGDKIARDFETLGRLHFKAAAYAEAGKNVERSLQLAPERGSALVLLAETRVKQNRVADAMPLFQRAIAAEIAAGRKPDENWYKRPLAIAYEAENPAAHGLARAWVAAYPSARNWHDAIGIHGSLSGQSSAQLLDMYRLARLNRALVGDADYGRYADAALARALPGEAIAVLDEGVAAGGIKLSQPTLKTIHASAKAKLAGDRAGLDARASAAATPKAMINVAEAYYSYGDHAKAAALLRSALGKPGVDANLANLRLGMALTGSGDKPGAKAALDLVGGPQAEIARYWLTYLASRP